MKRFNHFKGYLSETAFDAAAGNFVERRAKNPDFPSVFKASGEIEAMSSAASGKIGAPGKKSIVGRLPDGSIGDGCR